MLEGIVTKDSGAADFGISEDGSLVYVAGPHQRGVRRTLVWMDREGNEEAIAAEPRAYIYPRMSPDGSRLAVEVRDPERDIWIWDFARKTLTRLTFDPARDIYPAWTPDGLHVVFGSERDGTMNLFRKAADGTGTVEQLTQSANPLTPQTLSPDGARLVSRETHPEQGLNLVVGSLDGDGSSEPLLATEFNEMNAEISPDGLWLAYQSNASGQNEIYVRPFPNVDEGRWQISRDGGIMPLWSPDGRELFYLSSGRQLMAVTVRTDPSFTFGNPAIIFEGFSTLGALGRNYDISPDGKRFLMIKEGVPGDEAHATQVILVQNWLDELKRLVPVDN